MRGKWPRDRIAQRLHRDQKHRRDEEEKWEARVGRSELTVKS